MGLLKASDREQLKKEFEKLTNPVKLVFFTQTLDCEYCGLTQQVLEEVVSLSDKIQLQTYNFAIDTEQVANFRIARVPATAVVRVETQEKDGVSQTKDRDYGIRFYGVPAGFEFASLLGDILDVSSGDSGLSAQSKSALAGLKEPMHLQVFTTPTWPHCPTAVRLAHKMAMENELVTADMVDASEYPELSDSFQVYGVPLTVVNSAGRIEGGMPEPMFIPKVLGGAAASARPKILIPWREVLTDPIQKLLENSKTIAVVGASNHPARASLRVARYLQQTGYKIIPVNPHETEFLGERCYPDLLSVPDHVDVVDIFRNPEAVPEIVEQAIAIKAKGVWMQPGAENMAAAERAMEAGLEVVMGVCMMVEHQVLEGQRP